MLWAQQILDGSWTVAACSLFGAYVTWRLRRRTRDLGFALLGSGLAALVIGAPAVDLSVSKLPLGVPLLMMLAGAWALVIVRIDRRARTRGLLLSQVDPSFVFESDGVQFVVFPPQGPISRTAPGHFVAWAVNVTSTSRTIRLQPEEGHDNSLAQPHLRFATMHPVALQPGEGAHVVVEVTPCPVVTKRYGYLFASMRVAASEGPGARARVDHGTAVEWATIADRQAALRSVFRRRATWFGHQVELRDEPFASPPPPRSHVRVLSGQALNHALREDLQRRLAEPHQVGRRATE